jgi:hypothetical protein
LRLSDLLELFNGTVNIKDRIIIATTNNFEHIKKVFPALVRPGRLSPIEFKCLDWKTLNELTQYYFNSKMTLSEFEIIIPTSQITELAKKYVLSKLKFDDFQNELFLLNNIKNNIVIENKNHYNDIIKNNIEQIKNDKSEDDYKDNSKNEKLNIEINNYQIDPVVLKNTDDKNDNVIDTLKNKFENYRTELFMKYSDHDFQNNYNLNQSLQEIEYKLNEKKTYGKIMTQEEKEVNEIYLKTYLDIQIEKINKLANELSNIEKSITTDIDIKQNLLDNNELIYDSQNKKILEKEKKSNNILFSNETNLISFM